MTWHRISAVLGIIAMTIAVFGEPWWVRFFAAIVAILAFLEHGASCARRLQ